MASPRQKCFKSCCKQKRIDFFLSTFLFHLPFTGGETMTTRTVFVAVPGEHWPATPFSQFFHRIRPISAGVG